MIPLWLGKIVAMKIYKSIKHNRELKKIDDYVNKPNVLDKQMKQVQKNQSKILKNQEEIEKDLGILKTDSHPAQEYICCKKCGCKITKIKK